MKSKYKYQIPFYLCDENLQLRPDGLLKLLVDASMRNTDEVDGNVKGYNWILYRWFINTYENIEYKDEIEIETFSRKIDRFYAFRNFHIYKNGNKVLEADCKWILVSDEGNIARITPEVAEKYGQYEGFEMPRVEVKKLDSYSDKEAIKIRKADIDINGHVNNSNYLQYIFDVVNNDKKIKNIDIVYKKELRYGDQAEIFYQQDEVSFECAIITNDNVHTLTRIEFY